MGEHSDHSAGMGAFHSLGKGFDTAKTLSEALPYIQQYDKECVVIKFGGHAMKDADLSAAFARDIVLLKHLGIHPVVVHGGGPQIGQLLDKMGIMSQFDDGLRVTDAPTMEIVEMVLAGAINKGLVRAINAAGGKAVGLSGADANLIQATKIQRMYKDPDSHIERIVDLGFVGEPVKIDPGILISLIKAEDDFIPIIAPTGFDSKNQSYNVNADMAAGAIATALGAKRLLLLTDVVGVLDKKGKLIRELSTAQAKQLIKDNTATGGMIPKLETAIKTTNSGVEATVILDGRHPHALLVELFTQHGAGTLVLQNPKSE